MTFWKVVRRAGAIIEAYDRLSAFRAELLMLEAKIKGPPTSESVVLSPADRRLLVRVFTIAREAADRLES